MAIGREDATPSAPLQIGEVARRAGVTIRTVRFYEEKGLLAATTMTSGGIRLYSERDVNRLLFIRRLKTVGLSVEEIKTCLGSLSADLKRQARVEETIGLLSMQLGKVNEQITALTGVKREIEASLARLNGCLRCARARCPEQCTNRQLIL